MAINDAELRELMGDVAERVKTLRGLSPGVSEAIIATGDDQALRSYGAIGTGIFDLYQLLASKGLVTED